MVATHRWTWSIRDSSVYRRSVAWRRLTKEAKKPVRRSRKDFVLLALAING
jgi:hypothetical protein